MDEMNKQGLYIWLRSVVDSGRCPGVTWIDKANGVFQIPWSNQKSRTWQKEDSSVFLEYAKHTCKYKPGDKLDFPKWKQNLKSAINKNRYIERLRVKDHLSGPKPYRVYRFLNEKSERKRSSDNSPDDISNEAVEFWPQSYIPVIEIAGGLAVNNEALLVQRDTSASGSVVKFSDSESRSSRSSPLSATAVQNYFPLSPDIPRSDSCDQQQGNIPTFVLKYYGAISDNFGDDSLSSSLPESISANASLATPSNTDIVTGHVLITHRDRSENNANETLQGNDNQRLYSSKALVSTEIREHMWSEKLSNSVADNSHDTRNIAGLTQNSVCAKITHDSNDWTRQANVQGLLYAVTFQQSASGFTKDQLLNISDHVTRGAGLGLPMVGLRGVSQDCPSEPNMKTQQAGQESKCGIKDNRDTLKDYDFPTTSIPELHTFVECNSDLPSSMDTSDGNQELTGAQFTTHRGCQMPETAPKQPLMSPTTTTITEDSVMHVQVLYGTPHRTVHKFILTSQRSSCRLFCGAVKCSVMQKAIQGEQDAEEVELPPVDDPESACYDEDMKSSIVKVLSGMELGIVITYSNNDIFVERRCLPRVYLSDGVSMSESLPRSTKKRPDIKTLAFDYNKHFKEAIEQNKKNKNCAVPKDHFFLTIGYEIIANDESPTRKVPVYIVVRHVKAALERFKILGASTIAPNPMCSDPNSFDKNVQLFKELDLK